jgi:hypothetical protein
VTQWGLNGEKKEGENLVRHSLLVMLRNIFGHKTGPKDIT